MIDPFGRAARGLAPRTSPPSLHHPGWPESTPTVTLPGGWRVRLRPLSRVDGPAWRRQRLEDRELLKPVEPTQPMSWEEAHSVGQWVRYLLALRGLAQAGAVVPLAIEVSGRFAGQLTLGGIQRGSASECWLGYWVYSRYTRAGVATAACALGTDHAFRRLGLHRVTATYLPHNPASGRVLHLNGYREEGFLRANLHIDGAWRDHRLVAITARENRISAVDRLQAEHRLR